MSLFRVVNVLGLTRGVCLGALVVALVFLGGHACGTVEATDDAGQNQADSSVPGAADAAQADATQVDGGCMTGVFGTSTFGEACFGG